MDGVQKSGLVKRCGRRLCDLEGAQNLSEADIVGAKGVDELQGLAEQDEDGISTNMALRDSSVDPGVSIVDFGAPMDTSSTLRFFKSPSVAYNTK